MNIVCVPETKWKGDNKKKIENRYKMYTGKIIGRNGVSVIFDEAVKIKVVEVIRKSDWIIAFKFNSEYHTSQTECAEDEENAFWQDINEVM